jgi:hypothetical protein
MLRGWGEEIKSSVRAKIGRLKRYWSPADTGKEELGIEVLPSY